MDKEDILKRVIKDYENIVNKMPEKYYDNLMDVMDTILVGDVDVNDGETINYLKSVVKTNMKLERANPTKIDKTLQALDSSLEEMKKLNIKVLPRKDKPILDKFVKRTTEYFTHMGEAFDGRIAQKNVDKLTRLKLLKGGKNMLGPLAAIGLTLATSPSVEAAGDSLMEPLGGKVGEGSDKTAPISNEEIQGQINQLDDPNSALQKAMTPVQREQRKIELEGMIKQPSRGPAASFKDIEELKRVQKNPKLFNKLNPLQRIRLNTIVNSEEAYRSDPIIRETVNEIINRQELQEIGNEQLMRGLVSPEEHKAITKRTMMRKKQFEKARSIEVDAVRKNFQDNERFTQQALSIPRTAGDKNQEMMIEKLIRNEFKINKNKADKKTEKAQEIRQELKSEPDIGEV